MRKKKYNLDIKCMFIYNHDKHVLCQAQYILCSDLLVALNYLETKQ